MNIKNSMPLIPGQKTDNVINELGKIPVTLSLKQNNLKYHLMRDLLQKKNLEEIMLIQEKLQQEQENHGKQSKKNIRFPKAKKEISQMTNPHGVSKMSSSESSSEMSDDVEVFVDTS